MAATLSYNLFYRFTDNIYEYEDMYINAKDDMYEYITGKSEEQEDICSNTEDDMNEYIARIEWEEYLQTMLELNLVPNISDELQKTVAYISKEEVLEPVGTETETDNWDIDDSIELTPEELEEAFDNWDMYNSAFD
jgi:hypothetical protein